MNRTVSEMCTFSAHIGTLETTSNTDFFKSFNAHEFMKDKNNTVTTETCSDKYNRHIDFVNAITMDSTCKTNISKMFVEGKIKVGGTIPVELTHCINAADFAKLANLRSEYTTCAHPTYDASTYDR